MKVIRVLVYEGDDKWVMDTLARSEVRGNNRHGITELFVDPRRVEEGIVCCDIHDRCISRDQFIEALDASHSHFKLEQE